jgi:hypothetical protein
VIDPSGLKSALGNIDSDRVQGIFWGSVANDAQKALSYIQADFGENEICIQELFRFQQVSISTCLDDDRRTRHRVEGSSVLFLHFPSKTQAYNLVQLIEAFTKEETFLFQVNSISSIFTLKSRALLEFEVLHSNSMC